MARELAILVTARNMASGVLKDVRGDIKGIQSEARRGLQNTARNLGVAAAAGGVLVATQVKAGLESLVELERLTAQTNAVLKSTGSVAAGSVSDIRARSEALEKLTTVDDKVIQNAQNLLLTFTQIREDAFEPTLKAAIDMNAAMGGDDESLQQVLIQVGKAVNDPIKGLTALSRVGVSFTQQQKDQIKALVEGGNAAEAQQLILEELNKEFGGSAAAQADTYAGKMRKIADAVEDAQMALATAFLPVLERVGDELQTLLSDPDTLKNIEEFGGVLAEGLNDAIDIAKQLPWDAIGTTFSLMGQGARTVLDMFTKMPPWVQTAILTGWGLNKLTGGALGNIVGTLGSGLIKGVLGMNAGVVNINAGVVNGGTGGVPGTSGKGGGLGVLGAAGLAGVGLGVVTAVGTEVHRDLNPTGHAFNELAGGRGSSRVQVEGDLLTLSAETGQSVDSLREKAIPLLQNTDRKWSDVVGELRNNVKAVHDANASEGRRFAGLTAAQRAAEAAARSSDAAMLGSLRTIANKRTVFDPKITVNANLHNTVVVSGQQTIYRLNSMRQSLNAGSSVDGFI